MPVHDWSRVDLSIFHSFHLGWVSEICKALNAGLLPDRYHALSETLINEPDAGYFYAVRGVGVRRFNDRLAALVQIVSPESKSNPSRWNAFVRKVQDALAAGIHLLLVDLFPPGKCDPNGVHASVWEEMVGESHAMPPDKRLTLVSYEAGAPMSAYLEPIAVGDTLLDMPLFLNPGAYITVPLEATYQAEWRTMPKRWRDVLEPPAAGGQPSGAS